MSIDSVLAASVLADSISADIAPARQQSFLNAMRAVVNSVTVVTTDGPAGRAGVTVSATASVSVDGPTPLLLVCIHHRSPTAQAIAGNRVFCVNVLAVEQRAISDIFAGRQEHPAGKFGCATWSVGDTGAPLLRDAVAVLDCRVEDSLRKGSHIVFFGAVHDARSAAAKTPTLLYGRQSYGRLTHLGNDETMIHKRIRPFNTRDTYPEQKLDNDLCQAVVARGTMVFVRGQIGQDLDTSASIAIGDPRGQTARAMANIKMLLEEAGSDLAHICKITIYLVDPRYREEVYREIGRWLQGVFPVSTGIVVAALARPEWLVEIDATAVIPDDPANT